MTVAQKENMVDLFTENYSTLFGKFKTAQGKKTKDGAWADVVNALNNLGPAKTREQYVAVR